MTNPPRCAPERNVGRFSLLCLHVCWYYCVQSWSGEEKIAHRCVVQLENWSFHLNVHSLRTFAYLARSITTVFLTPSLQKTFAEVHCSVEVSSQKHKNLYFLPFFILLVAVLVAQMAAYAAPWVRRTLWTAMRRWFFFLDTLPVLL